MKFFKDHIFSPIINESKILINKMMGVEPSIIVPKINSGNSLKEQSIAEGPPIFDTEEYLELNDEPKFEDEYIFDETYSENELTEEDVFDDEVSFESKNLAIISRIPIMIEGIEKIISGDSEDSAFYLSIAEECYSKTKNSNELLIEVYYEGTIISIYYIYMYILNKHGKDSTISPSYYQDLTSAYELARNNLDKESVSFKGTEALFYDIIKSCWNNNAKLLRTCEINVRIDGGDKQDYLNAYMLIQSFKYLLMYISEPKYTKRVIKSLRFLSLQLGII